MTFKNIKKLVATFKAKSTERSVDGESIWDFYIIKNQIMYECSDMIMILKSYPGFVIEFSFDLTKKTVKVIFYKTKEQFVSGWAAKKEFLKLYLTPKMMTRELNKMIDKYQE